MLPLDGPIKGAIGGDDGLGQKLAASCCSGAFASLCGCPTDVVKVRLQCESGRRDPKTGVFTTGLYEGKHPTYENSIHAVRAIWQTEGVGGFCE